MKNPLGLIFLTEGIGIVKLWLLLLLPRGKKNLHLRKAPSHSKHNPQSSLLLQFHKQKTCKWRKGVRAALWVIQKGRHSQMEKYEHSLGPSERRREFEMCWDVETCTARPFTAQQGQKWGCRPREKRNIKATEQSSSKKKYTFHHAASIKHYHKTLILLRIHSDFHSDCFNFRLLYLAFIWSAIF